MKTIILKAIQKGINEGLANFDMDDYEDEHSSESKKTIYQDNSLEVMQHSIEMLKLVEKPNVSVEDIQQCLDLYNQYGSKCPVNDSNIKKIVHKAINVWPNYELDLNWIDTSKVTDMRYLFSDTKFDGDISKWDTSNVTTMASMFNNAEEFNQPIGNWDVSNVTNMEGMFHQAWMFNQPIGDWDVSNVYDMSFMFKQANNFDQDISNWKIRHDCNRYCWFQYACIRKEYIPKI